MSRRRVVDAADILFHQRAGEHALFQFLDLAVNGFADRLVVLGDEVQQGIQHEILPVLQQ